MRSFFQKLSVGIGALLLIGCMTTNEVTGRSQFMIFPASEDVAMGAQAFAEISKNAKIVESGPMADRINRIGKRIAAVSHNPDFPWEFAVINEDVMNAFALPGGKVAFYTKMMKTFPEDDMLAAIMGHEIAHAVLRHGAEQVSRAQAQQAGIASIAIGLGLSNDDQEQNNTIVMLAGLATQVGIALPHGRDMELEADDIGAVYMAKAGYDPRKAVEVWKRMHKMSGGSSQPKWLSTHPSNTKRIERLSENMPKYLKAYKARAK